MGRFRFGSVTGVVVVLILGSGTALLGLLALAPGTDGWGSATLLDSGIPTAGYPKTAMDPDGNAIAVWEKCEVVDLGSQPSHCAIWGIHFSSGVGWGTPTPVGTGGDEGARFPELAMDRSGRAIVVWSSFYGPRYGWEFSDILANRFDPEVGWGEPTVVATGDTSFIRDVAVDDSGNAIAVWEQCSKIRCGVMASLFSPTDGWGMATPLDRSDSASNGFAQVAMDAVGNAVAVWEQGDGRTWSSVWSNRFDPSLGWGTPTALETEETGDAALPQVGHWAAEPKVAMNEEGVATAVWTTWSEREGPTLWANRLLPKVGWGTATPVARFSAGWSPKLVQVVTDATGDAVAVWVEQNLGGFDYVFANRYIRGVGWTTPTQLGETRNSCGTECYAIQFAADVSPNGDVIVAWGSESNKAMFANRFDPHSGWGASEWIGAGVPTCGPCPPDIDVDSVGNAMVVWTQWAGNNLMNIWANRFVSPFQDSRTALADLDGKVRLLLISQTALVVTAAVSFVMYWNARRGIWAGGGNKAGDADPSKPLRLQGGRLGRPRLKGGVVGNSPTHGIASAPWSRAGLGGSLHVTAKERILLHLFDFAKYADSLEVPPGLTPGGIAHAAGIDGRHFAQYIRPLVKEELVRGRTARLRGDVQRRKVYVLTDDGRRAAIGIRDRLRSVVVRVRDASGQREATVAEVLAETRGSRSILDILGESVRDGVVSRER